MVQRMCYSKVSDMGRLVTELSSKVDIFLEIAHRERIWRMGSGKERL